MPYDHALRLADEIAKVCPWVECSLNGFVPAPSATPEQIAAGNVVFNSFVQDEALYDQWLVANFRKKAQAALYNTKTEAFAVDRALALILLREVNNLRTWLRDFKAAVAASTNLANLQSRVAALPNTPDYTQQQLMDAIKTKLADGSADSI